MLQFTHPWFLLALGALAAPLLIHLISRLRATPIRFPSIRFITRAPLPRQGRRRLSDWWLYFLRSLFYLCLILVLAGPRWVPEGTADPATAGAKDALVLLDLSASLSGWDQWENAQEQVLDWLDDDDAARIGLIPFARDIRAPLEPTHDRAAVREAIRRLRPTNEEGVPQLGIEWAGRMVRELNIGRVVIVSDFQASNWSGVSLAALEPATIEKIEVKRTSPPATFNRAVLPVVSFATENGLFRVLAQVRQFGGLPGTTEVELVADGVTHTREIRLEPDGTAQVVFEIERPENPRAEVRLPDDAFAEDNTWYFWAGETPPLRIVIPNLPEQPESDEAYFLSRALSAMGGTDWVRFEPVSVSTGFLTPEFLRYADILFLPANVAASPQLDWDLVAGYLENGGFVVATLDREAARTLNAMSAAGVADIEYAGIEGRQRELRRRVAIDWVNPSTRLDEVFRDDARRDLLLVDLRRYVQLQRVSAEGVLVAASTNDPLIVRAPVGSGTLILSAFPWDTSWSDFPLRNSFLPMVRELFKMIRLDDAGIVRLRCGEPLPDRFLTASSVDTSQPAVLRVEERPVEINVSRSESSPERMPLTLPSADESRAARQAARAEAAASAGIPLWPMLLTAAFIIFLIETLSSARGRDNDAFGSAGP